MFGRYRHTPLGSIKLSDSLVGLVANFAITVDIDKAAERAPFRFDPVADAEFYRDIYWEVPYEDQIAAAKRLKRRFDRWYKCAQPMEQVFLAVVGLTASDEMIDTIIDDTKAALLAKHQMPLIDADDAIYQITDFHAVRDPLNIRNALNTENINWWCRQFEEQAHRIKNAPTMNFDQFISWNRARMDHEDMIREYFHRCQFANNGLSTRAGRKVVRRTYENMASVFGEKQTRDFCKGHPLEIRAHHFVWKLTLKPRNLVRYTVDPPNSHVPYSLDLHDHDGQRLASACIIFQDQPVLDQVVQLSVSLDTPDNELDVLRTANIFLLTPAGEANERLSSGSFNITWPQRERDEHDEFRNMLAREATDRPHIEGWVCNIEEFDDPGLGIDNNTRLVMAQQRAREDELIDLHVQDLSRILNLPIQTGQDTNGLIRSLYGNVLRDQARIMLRRRRDPIAQLIREELYRRLDVMPDLLEYMSLPEFRYQYMGRLKHKCTPRLQQFIERKLPLGLGEFT